MKLYDYHVASRQVPLLQQVRAIERVLHLSLDYEKASFFIALPAVESKVIFNTCRILETSVGNDKSLNIAL